MANIARNNVQLTGVSVEEGSVRPGSSVTTETSVCALVEGAMEGLELSSTVAGVGENTEVSHFTGAVSTEVSHLAGAVNVIVSCSAAGKLLSLEVSRSTSGAGENTEVSRP